MTRSPESRLVALLMARRTKVRELFNDGVTERNRAYREGRETDALVWSGKIEFHRGAAKEIDEAIKIAKRWAAREAKRYEGEL